MSFGKDFDYTYNMATEAFSRGAYQKSAELFDKALEIRNGIFPLSGYNEDALKAWSKVGDKDKMFFYLNMLIEKGWISLDILNSSDYFNLIRYDKRWNEIINIVKNKEIKYGHIVRKIEDIHEKDQALRQIIACAKEKFEQDTTKMTYFWELMEEQDKENLQYVEDIVKKYGWLGKNKIGDKANSTLWLILQHSPVEIQLKYLPLVKESVLKGETAASDFAFLVDRTSLYLGKEQVYGTQVIYIEEKDIYKVYPIKEPQQVDVRRKEIGFEPLVDYLSFFGIKNVSLDSLSDFSVYKYVKK